MKLIDEDKKPYIVETVITKVRKYNPNYCVSGRI